jgi:hypothetical protein
MVLNAILNALKSGLQRDRSTHRRAIFNASKVGSHFSYYDCACVVTITGSPAGITYEDYFFGQIVGSRQDAEWLQRASGEPNGGSGWGGIRTHGTLAGTPVFKTGALNHSATHPSN